MDGAPSPAAPPSRLVVEGLPTVADSTQAPTSGVAERPPLHVAIIMDGNGRWARERGLPRALGHRAGVEAVRRTVEPRSS